MAKPVTGKPKKTYETPALVVYGTVRDLTQKTIRSTHPDGGGFPRNHTSV
jgi:hypothetical protein